VGEEGGGRREGSSKLYGSEEGESNKYRREYREGRGNKTSWRGKVPLLPNYPFPLCLSLSPILNLYLEE
jgi:hypothetical protein